jgi:hypothetical protein
MNITLLHPSRGRVEKAYNTANKWFERRSHKYDVKHVLSIDFSDPENDNYRKHFHHINGISGRGQIITNNNESVVDATNKACLFSKGDILVYLSDDFDCPYLWDELIVQKVKSVLSCGFHKPWLLKVDDCLQKFEVPVLTIPIMSRALYEKLGYFWHPGYKSMFVDEDLYWTTKNNNWLIEAPELKFPHEHCCNGKAENDETYKRSAANWDQGKAMFAKRRLEGFPL